jgi:hypothetical protein
MSWTKSGTVSLTNNSKIVYGSGTTWAAGGKARAGDVFVAPSGALYEVESIESNTELHLVNNYLGATASGQTYALIHTGLLPAELAVGLSDLQSKYLATIAQLYDWETSTADTVPITNPATGVTTNVKPLVRFLASLGDASADARFQSLLVDKNSADVRAVVRNNNAAASVSKTVALTLHGTDTVGTHKEAATLFVTPMENDYINTSLSLLLRSGDAVVERAKFQSNDIYWFSRAPSESYGRPQLTIGGGDGGLFEFSDSIGGHSIVYRDKNSNSLVIDGRSANSNVRIQSAGEGSVIFNAAGVDRVLVNPSGQVVPLADNAQSMGNASNRWSVVYAGSGSINTSDARLKTPIEALSVAELAAAQQLAAEVGTFRFLESVAEKGDAARMHIGLTVQRAIEIMEGEGLNPFAYGFVCHDQWDDQVREVETDADDPEGVAREVEVQRTAPRLVERRKVEVIDGRPVLVTTTEEVDTPVFEALEVTDEAGCVVMIPDQPATEAVLDEEGNERRPAMEATWKPMTHQVPVMETVTRYYKTVIDQPAGDRYSFRYDELAMFICRGFADRLAALEAAQ